MIGNSIEKAREILESGELVAIPTETVYGLAGNACDETTVSKIFEAKARPFFDPLIVHISSFNEVEKWVKEIHPIAEKLAKHFWPGALTILFPKNDKISNLVTSGSDYVALRVPNHSLTLKLLSTLAFPLAAPSANPFGYISPTKAEHVFQNLGNKIPYILDGGPCYVGLESTIVLPLENELHIYRKGGISQEILEDFLQIPVKFVGQLNLPEISSPGTLSVHYSPITKFEINNSDETYDYEKENTLFLRFQNHHEDYPTKNQLILSESGNINEAACHLFDFMRILDERKEKLIVAQALPENGLGMAINDRLSRAAAKRHENG